MKFTKIPENAFQTLQLNAGIMLKTFDPATASVEASSYIGATGGGINFKAVPTYKDMAEGLDNAPKNMKELKTIESMDISMTGTLKTLTAETAKDLVAAADIDSTDPTKIVPRMDLKDEDFSDVWWVGDYSDKNGETNGGFVAIHMMNVLNTGGFQIQTSDKDKGQFPFTYTAHYSIKDQSTVPFEIYVKAGTDEPAA